MSTVARPRFVYVDVLRVLGILLVIAAHIGDLAYRFTFIFSWAVPLFFILSGYFWVDRPLSVEWSRRWRSLARPYAFWFAFTLVVFVVRLSLDHELSLGLLKGEVWGGYYATRPFTTFWFISALFFTCILYRVVCRLKPTTQGALAVAGLLAGYLFGGLLARTPLAAGSAVACLSLVMLGRLAQHYKPRLGGAPVGAVLVVVSLTLTAMDVAYPMDIKQGGFGTPVLSILLASATSIGLLLLTEPLFARTPARVASAITALGASGLVVVFVHPVVLYFLDVPSVPGLLQLVIIPAVCWSVGLAALYSPAAELITGTRRTDIGGRTKVG